jgi:hypothetical protein
MNRMIILYLLIILTYPCYGQEDFDSFVRLNRGRMWYDLFAYGGHGDRLSGDRYHKMDYPGCAWSPLRGIYHPMIPEYPGMDGYMFIGTVEDSVVLYRIPFRSEWFRSHEILEGDREKLTNNLLLKKVEPEQTASGSVQLVSYNIEMAWRAMVWSHEKYDDFIIWEYTFTNLNTDKTIYDFRFARACEISIGCNTVDNASRKSTTEDDYYEWDPQHQLFYFHDGWQLSQADNMPIEQIYGYTKSDKGEPADYEHPASIKHNFEAPQYLTFTWLDKSKEPSEPDHMNCTARWRWPQPPNEDESTFWWHNSGVDDKFLLTMTYDQNPPDIKENGDPMPADSVLNTPRARRYIDCYPLYIFETGAYDLIPGETLTLVLATVGGHMDWERVANLVHKPEEALENAAHLIDGKTEMFKNLEAAREIYANNYLCPVPPPTPTALDSRYGNSPDDYGSNSLLLMPMVNACKIQWYPIEDDYTDRDYDINDVVGYRIYHSKLDCFGPWELIVEIPIDSTAYYLEDEMMTYIDRNRDPSQPLHYVVTTFDTGHDSWPLDQTGAYAGGVPSLESAKNNYNVAPVFALVEAANATFKTTMRVYPNPFKLVSQIPGSDYKIDFVNIPAKCTIRIYTLAGDLVTILEHNDNSGITEWASTYHLELGVPVSKGYMFNKNWQRIMPGIYLYHVESHVPGFEGESKIGKFVIIR